jgi:hypothetical protein
MVSSGCRSFTLSAEGIEVTLDLDVGHLSAFKVERRDRQISPFHKAPWGKEEMDDSIPPHLRKLSIDFFCAPFGASDVEDAPAHGWPANSSWDLSDVERLSDGSRATFKLSRTVMTAMLTKTLTVRDGHPFLYQSHRFTGGAGSLPVAYHAMIDLPNGGLISVSPKLRAQTPHDALEPDPARGRSMLAYPAVSGNLSRFPSLDGGVSDLLRYPLDDNHVDLVMLHEQPSNQLGWVVVARPAERDMALVLKSPAMLPSTVLWYSNGGRAYEPWNGRHRGVLGVEEARTFFGQGHRASIAPNILSDSGIPTSLNLEGTQDVRSIIGACEMIDREGTVSTLDALNGCLRMIGARGDFFELPFDNEFLNQFSPL